ncbi:MAG: Dolichyl-phosphate beta-glucosyltransferase [Parcubacteria group bacterium GW2011_GWA2_46_7]|nr:MAG: Dolichyl-phosphate beta-glucosyltransferase [Parcubacteria group bacterium GW2011_GWA2_46_7]
MNENRKPSISVIIPVFNEEKTIQSTIESVCAYCDANGFPYEVVVVNDGSQDGTAGVVESLLGRYPMLRMLDNGTNTGKGYAVRNGMLHATGDLALFMDADGSTKISELGKVLEKYTQGYGVIMGSRKIPGAYIAVHQPKFRELSGRMMNVFIRVATGLPFEDTQVGFKAFSHQARETIFPLQRTSRWIFDVELLVIAAQNRISVAEIPITWENNSNSRVKVVHLGRTIAELVIIRLNKMRGWYVKRS